MTMVVALMMKFLVLGVELSRGWSLWRPLLQLLFESLWRWVFVIAIAVLVSIQITVSITAAISISDAVAVSVTVIATLTTSILVPVGQPV